MSGCHIIYNELIFRGYNVDVGVVSDFATDSEQKRHRKSYEVDFVCNKVSDRYYIQSAFSIPTAEKLQQEINSLIRIPDSFKKILIVKDTGRPWFTEEGILVIGLFDFLLKADSLNM